MDFDWPNVDWTQWHFSGECPDWQQPRMLVKSNAVRQVYALGKPVTHFVKIEKNTSFSANFRALFLCKARAEFQIGKLLEQRGIPVVEYTAWGTHTPYQIVISRAFAGSYSAHRYLYREIVYAGQKGNTFIYDLKKFLQCFIRGKCNHPDLHLGNILYNPETREMRLVDVYGVKTVRELGEREYFQIAHLVTELSPLLAQQEQQQFLLDLELPEVPKLLERIQNYELCRFKHDVERRLHQLQNGYDKFATITHKGAETIYCFKDRLRQPKIRVEELPPLSEWQQLSEEETHLALTAVIAGLTLMAEPESPLLAWDGNNRFFSSEAPIVPESCNKQ